MIINDRDSCLGFRSDRLLWISPTLVSRWDRKGHNNVHGLHCLKKVNIDCKSGHVNEVLTPGMLSINQEGYVRSCFGAHIWLIVARIVDVAF
jgi:hypothetical protein